MNNADDYNTRDGIAIIGMAGRFPGARDIDHFWSNLLAGKESITYFQPHEISPLVPQQEKDSPNYVPARGILEDIDMFDADFFGIPPIEAAVMDPQQRLFLELCWEAIENAGYNVEEIKGLVGVYAGMNNNLYYLNHVLTRPDILEQIGPFQAMLANEKDFLTTRVSYKLNLKGPSENIYTACSTGLVSIIKAFQALMTYQCDMALAGGVSIILPQNSGYLYQKGGMLSPDGHCRPFDKNSKGTTFNSGAGVVVLKRYEDALKDYDHIFALLIGTGLNNDGKEKVSFTAPSVKGQEDAISMAIAQADIPPESIFYIETHGTATPMGDPIEVAALTNALAIPPQKGKTCFIGSVKSNIGHLIHAAGVAGFIKTVLALYHKKIPPTINFNSPNPHIHWDRNPFQVCSSLIQWDDEKKPRRAGVSSFGVGGTNAHVILEEATPAPLDDGKLPFYLLPITARSKEALNAQLKKFSRYLGEKKPRLIDVAFTLQNGRKHFNHRVYGIFKTLEDASRTLSDNKSSSLSYAHTHQHDPEIIFMFPGQGSQHINMGCGLYKYDSLFREIVEYGASILEPILQLEILSIIYSEAQENSKQLTQTSIAQPALFLIEYAISEIWKNLGIQPTAMIGHSIGELTAACVSGVFSFEDGLRIVAERARLMQRCKTGSMLSVRLSATELEKRLSHEVVISNINAPNLCVAAGRSDIISALHRQLKQEGITSKILSTSHAFHSPDMDTAATQFEVFLEQFRLSPPSIPFISCLSGDWITSEQAISPTYWANQIRYPVQFAQGISSLLKGKDNVCLLETGPLTVNATLARQNLKGKDAAVISTCGKIEGPEQDYHSFLKACGLLWLQGTNIEWEFLYKDEHPIRTPLPTSPFNKKRFWIEPGTPRQKKYEHREPVSEPLSEPNLSEAKMATNDACEMIIKKICEIIYETTGIEADPDRPDQSFLEAGLDSLFLTQLATTINNKFHVDIQFRNLLDDLSTPSLLAQYLYSNAEPSTLPPSSSEEKEQDINDYDIVSGEERILDTEFHYERTSYPLNGSTNSLQTILTQQLQIMTKQLEILSGQAPAGSGIHRESRNQNEKTENSPNKETSTAIIPQELEAADKTSKPFGPSARIHKESNSTLTPEQQEFLDELICRYTRKTKGSKEFATRNRECLADPRTVSGFRPIFKEMIYQIVVEKSKGCHLWDIDGNEYIDLLNGFGSNFFGYSADFVMKNVSEQMKRGIEIGPQHPLTEDITRLMRKFTKLDRFAFCNTGSEAVLGCMRIARTVTGRKKIVMFDGAYHGIFDEVIVRGTPNLKSFPGAPGINNESVINTIVLEYGVEKSLEIIKERIKEIAAIMVEPVQSRNPALQPQRFLKQLRNIADESGAALIIDEVITGFRIHPRGAQGYFGVEADLASYGKVIGGGLPIGIIGGKRRFMDALDGGQWQFGDDSFPEAGVTYFAGTFVRHPMALAACSAVLNHLEEQGPNLQKTMNRKADTFCNKLNNIFSSFNAPLRIDNFGTLMKIQFEQDSPMNELLYFLLREKGIHIWDARPIFLTTEHTDEDLEIVYQAFTESISQLQSVGLMINTKTNDAGTQTPPVPGARLGKTPSGTTAWFIADPERPGKYRMISEQ